MQQPYVAVTTGLKRAKLQDAWDAAPDEANTLRDQLRAEARAASGMVNPDGGIFSTSSNSHSTSAFIPGSNQPTGAAFVEMWQELVDYFDRTRIFLLTCARRGLDAWETNRVGFADPAPALVNPALTIDSNGDWAIVAETYQIDPAKVVGVPVSDEAVYLWMMDHLVPVKERGSSYTFMRTPPSLNVV